MLCHAGPPPVLSHGPRPSSGLGLLHPTPTPTSSILVTFHPVAEPVNILEVTSGLSLPRAGTERADELGLVPGAAAPPV